MRRRASKPRPLPLPRREARRLRSSRRLTGRVGCQQSPWASAAIHVQADPGVDSGPASASGTVLPVAGAKFIRADLHVHTHSDGDIDPSPHFDAYVKAAQAADLDILGITDHNTTRFVREAIKA